MSSKISFHKEHPVINVFYLIGCWIFFSGAVIKAYRLYYWLKHGVWLKKYVWEYLPKQLIENLVNWETWVGFKQLILWITQWIMLCDISNFMIWSGGLLFILMGWLEMKL
jgi:hypothetical protein